MSWDGVERRRHERYVVSQRVTIAIPVETCCEDAEEDTPPVPWTTAGTSIPYRQRRRNGDGTGQDIRRKGAGRKAHR